MSFKPFLLALVGFLAAAAAPYDPPHIGTRVVYRHAGLIDGTGAPLRADMAVVTDGETITTIVPDSGLTGRLLGGARQVDLSGAYLLPGLIDSHQHIATPPDRPAAEASLRRALYGGITAIRDMADDLRQVGDLARAARVGEIAAPDIYYAALMAGPSFFEDVRTGAAAQGADAGRVPWMQAIDERTDLPLAVAMARGTSATAIKIYANLPGPLVARIAQEAHRQGIMVWAHGMVFPATPAEVVGAGVDSVSHVCYLAYQAMDRRPDSYEHRFPVDAALFEPGDNPAMASLFAEMRRRGTILDATNRVYEAVEASAHLAGKPPQCTVALAARLTNQAWRAGVAISAGTDGDNPPSYPWPSLFEEIGLLAKAGMPPADVIRSATMVGAMAIGRQNEMGSIAPGKLANFLIVGGNPLDDLRNLQKVVMTVKRGRAFPRVDYTLPAIGRP